jgi:hypothetical protein
MSDIIEAVARAICVAEGLDPDKTSIGFGHRIPVGVKYKLWEAQRWNAEAAIAAVGVETEQLRARVEVLETIRAAAQALIDYEDSDTYDPAGKGWEYWEENLRAALEAKP